MGAKIKIRTSSLGDKTHCYIDLTKEEYEHIYDHVVKFRLMVNRIDSNSSLIHVNEIFIVFTPINYFGEVKEIIQNLILEM